MERLRQVSETGPSWLSPCVGGRYRWSTPAPSPEAQSQTVADVTSKDAVPRRGEQMTGARRGLVMLVLFAAILPVMQGCYDVCTPIGSPLSDGEDGYLISCLLCHDKPAGERRAIVDESGAGGHTLGQENVTTGTCLLCHDITQHAGGVVRLWKGAGRREAIIEVPGDPSRDPDEADKVTEFCTACHGDPKHATHTVKGDWQPACTACHDLHNPYGQNLNMVSDSVYNWTLDIDAQVVFTSKGGLGSFDDGDPSSNDGICQVCHTNTSYHLYDGTGTPHYDGIDCTVCHPHDTGFLPAGGASCVSCHSSPQDNEDGIPVGGRPKVVNADGTGGHHYPDEVQADDRCITCHEMTRHQQGTVRLWTDPVRREAVIQVAGDPARDPDEANQITELCMGCHNVDGYSAHGVGGDWQPACVACHDIHDTANGNLSLVSESVYSRTLDTAAPVVFTARSGPGSFDDGDPASNDGICQVCHTETAYHTHDGSGAPHNDGTDCTICHSHRDGFKPTERSSCIVCHSTRQGNRDAVVNTDGSGGHHLTGSVLADQDCIVCHETGGHRRGTVRLWTDPNDPTTPFAITGDPKDEKLLSFCSSCHDSLTHPLIHRTGAGWEPVCTECHEIHDPKNGNLSLVRDVIRNETLGMNKPVVFTSRTGAKSFDDGDSARNDGICQVCHTKTTYHLHDGTGTPHNDGMDCAICHPHPRGFKPDFYACRQCHSGDLADTHHLLYARPIPPRSVVPFPDAASDGVRDTNYVCLSCHDQNFTATRYCTACHSPGNPHD